MRIVEPRDRQSAGGGCVPLSDLRVARLVRMLRVVVWDGPMNVAPGVAMLDSRRPIGEQAGEILRLLGDSQQAADRR